MITRKKAEEVSAMVEMFGKRDAADKLGLSEETVSRYLRVLHDPDEEPSAPKILLLDIETAPAKALVFDVWNQNIMDEQITQDWFILSWAGKWLFDSETFGDVVTAAESKECDDERIMRSLLATMNDADIIIGHNIDKFDIPRINTRLLINGLHQPMPYRTVDTRKILKKNFSFMHNKLNFANRILGLSTKLDTGGFHLWKGCVFGEADSLKKMFEYNKNDVGILEELYVEIRGWAKSHPNMNLFVSTDDTSCPNCGGHDLTYGGEYTANVNKYRAFRCKECGAIGRTSKALPKKNNMLISVAR